MIDPTQRRNEMIQLWLFLWGVWDFLAPRHRGMGFAGGCHLWVGLQVMLRNSTSSCPDHGKRVWISTEGWPGKLDCFLWSNFTELLKHNSSSSDPKKTWRIPLSEKWEMTCSRCSSEPEHRTELTPIPKCDDRVDQKDKV